MGLARRIIPLLLVRDGQLVKGVRFDSRRTVGHARQAVMIHQTRKVDELILLDVAATERGQGPDLDQLQSLAGVCFMPLTVGGGVRHLNDIRELFIHGADKVAICTAAQENLGLVRAATERFGSQAITVALDAVRTRRGWQVATHCGQVVSSQYDVVSAAIQAVRDGAGEILLTSVDRDGTLSGYDLDLIKAVAPYCPVPLVVAGGAGSYEDMRLALEAGANAVAAGSLFQWTDATPQGAAEYLAEHGIEVRQ